jgi:hypothetical protein
MVPQQALPAAVIGLGLVTAACGGSTSTRTSLTAPAGVRCQAALEPTAASFGPAGGTSTVSVAAARECQWSAVSGSAWVTVISGAQSQGDGTVTYRVAENVDPLARQGALAVGGHDITVTQEAASCRFGVSHDAAEPLPAEGGHALIHVQTHGLCDWTAASDVPWAAVSPAASRGAAAVRVSVDQNPGGVRSGDIVVAGERLGIIQRAGTTSPGPSPPPAPTPTSPAPPPAPAPTPTPAPPSPPPDSSPLPVRRVEIEGRIQQLEGSCPSRTFRVGQALVYTTPATRYDDVTCATLRNGMSVEVEGMLMSDGRIRADEVERD